jgi:hypothetical protein
MTCSFRCWPVWLAIGLLFIAGTNSRLMAEVGAASVDTKTIDQNLHVALRDVINQGADLFNQGDPSGCYRLFQGALMTTRSQLGHHADVQKLIDDGLARTDVGSMGKRAWILRKLLDDVRERINPNPKKPAVKDKSSDTPPAKTPEKKSEEAKPNEKKTQTDKTKEGKPEDKKPDDAKPPEKKPDDKNKDN